MMDRSVRALLMAGVATAALVAPSIAQDNIGVTAAVNPQAQGTPPDRASRTLNVGLDMFKNERVATGPEGKTQLLFIDGSALSIGPNSEVVLDEFVYDPATETGKLAMTATKGVFRLVGGKLSKNEPVTLKTPTATIGIRGGVATVSLPSAGGPPPFTSLDFGKALTVEGPSAETGQPVSFVVTRAGTGVVFGPGGGLLPPGPIQQELLASALNAVEGSRGSSGGAREQPTDGRVQQAGVGSQGSSLEPDAVREAEGIAADISNVGTEVGESVNLSQASTLGFSDLNSSSSSGGIQSFLLSGRYKTTPGSGNARGPGDTSTAFNRLLFGDILGTLFSGITINLSSFSEFSFDNDFMAPVTGTLVETLPRGKFFSFTSGGTTSPFGPISGKVFVSNMNDFVFFSNIEENFSSGLERSIAFAGIPTPFAVLDPPMPTLAFRLDPDAVMGSNLAFLMSASGGSLAGVRSNLYVAPSMGTSGPATVLQANLAIIGQGTSQQSAASVMTGRIVNSLLGTNVNLDGRMRGSARLATNQAPSFASGAIGLSTDASGNGVFGIDGPNFFVLESSQVGSNMLPGSSEFQASGLPVATGLTESGTNPSTSTLYFPTNLGIRVDTPSGVGVTRTTRTLGGFANGFIDTFNSSGSYTGTFLNPFLSSGTSFGISTNASTSTLSGMFNGSAGAVNFVLPFGGSGGLSAFVDDKTYAAVEASSGALRNGTAPTTFQMYVVGNDLVTTTGFLPAGVSYCACTLSTFGFWGIDVLHSAGRDRIHLGQFVAGPALTSVPASGVATYTGHAVADIIVTTSSPQNHFKAAAGFSMGYNFGTAQMTSWNVNFGGGNQINASGSIGSPGTPNINGSGSGTAPVIGSVSVSVTGTFFGTSPGAIPPEVGTSFNGSGTGGRIVGVTQGKM